MENNISALDWFYEELKKHKLLTLPLTKGANALYEKAKEMEERIIAEQSVESYHRGYEEAESHYRWPVSKQLQETNNQ